MRGGQRLVLLQHLLPTARLVTMQLHPPVLLILPAVFWELLQLTQLHHNTETTVRCLQWQLHVFLPKLVPHLPATCCPIPTKLPRSYPPQIPSQRPLR